MRKTLLTAIALGAAVSSADAQQLFTWNGRVDQEVQITVTGRNVTTSSIGLREPGNASASVMAALPREQGTISISSSFGRGSVDVIQQPTAANGYTAIIRVRDPQSSWADYRFTAYFNPTANGEVGPPYGRGRGVYERERADSMRMMRDSMRAARNGNRTVLHWSGEIDDNVRINLGPNGLTYRTVSGKEPGGVSSNFTGIPSGARTLVVTQTEGRGSVVVIRQPTAANNYTAVIRVMDPQRGSSHYTFDVSWR